MKRKELQEIAEELSGLIDDLTEDDDLDPDDILDVTEELGGLRDDLEDILQNGKPEENEASFFRDVIEIVRKIELASDADDPDSFINGLGELQQLFESAKDQFPE